MKSEQQANPQPSWYEEIWNNVEMVNTNPELDAYLDVEKMPQYRVNLLAALIGQGMPLTPPKKLKSITPEKLGRVLGQQCATAYTLGESLKPLADPKLVEKAVASFSNLEKHADVPGVSSLFHAGNVTGLLLEEFTKYFPEFERKVHMAFKAALDQPNYQEAVEFFRGYAAGLARPGIKNGQLAKRTEATTLQTKMFMHSEEISKLKNVRELRAFLLKNGVTKQMLGDDERLQKLCTRLGYAPGKRGRPSKPQK